MRQILQSAMVAGLLLVAGLAITLSPSMSGQAQQTGQEQRTREELGELQAADRDLQAQIEQLAARLRALEAMRRQHMDLATKLKAATPESHPSEPRGGPRPMGPAVGGPGMGRAMAGGGGGSAGRNQADLNQRLDGLEKKLDAVLWEVTHMRQEMSKPHAAPGGRFSVAPGASPSANHDLFFELKNPNSTTPPSNRRKGTSDAPGSAAPPATVPAPPRTGAGLPGSAPRTAEPSPAAVPPAGVPPAAEPRPRDATPAEKK